MTFSMYVAFIYYISTLCKLKLILSLSQTSKAEKGFLNENKSLEQLGETCTVFMHTYNAIEHVRMMDLYYALLENHITAIAIGEGGGGENGENLYTHKTVTLKIIKNLFITVSFP